MRLRHCLLPAAFCALLSAAQQPKPSDDLCALPPSNARPSLPAKLLPGQGRIVMPITTRSAQAQEFFNQGVAQMHSFWSREAERSFLQAAELDPEAPMAQWGIAMVAAGDYRPAFQLTEGDNKPRRPAAQTPPTSSPKWPSGPERAREAALKAQQLSGRATPLEKLYITAVAARRNKDSQDADGDCLVNRNGVDLHCFLPG